MHESSSPGLPRVRTLFQPSLRDSAVPHRCAAASPQAAAERQTRRHRARYALAILMALAALAPAEKVVAGPAVTTLGAPQSPPAPERRLDAAAGRSARRSAEVASRLELLRRHLRAHQERTGPEQAQGKQTPAEESR